MSSMNKSVFYGRKFDIFLDISMSERALRAQLIQDKYLVE